MSIEFHQVSKRFDNGFDGLRDVSVTFGEGSMTFLTGHSGAGRPIRRDRRASASVIRASASSSGVAAGSSRA
jgi:ABC-type Na+ transport system ATPase subunit NatA